MATLAISSAERTRRRRRWFDPRLAIGLALVVASVGGVVGLVTAMNRTVIVYAAGRTLAAGTLIGAKDLVATPVRIGSVQPLYLTKPLGASGAVTTRSIADGELVPLASLGTAAGAADASVVVTVGAKLPTNVSVGSSFDLWSAPKTATGTYGSPAVLVPGAVVASLLGSDGIVSGGGTTIEVRVPRDSVPQVLEAVANDDAISVVGTSEPVHQ